MHNTILSCLFVAGMVLAESLTAEPATGDAKDVSAPRSFQIEMEDFSLTDCDVASLTNASGGKAVLIAKESSKAQTTIKLPKGDYSVVFWTMAPSLQCDTVWVTIGDVGKASPWEGKCKSYPDHKRMPMKDFMSSGVYVGARERVVVHVTEDGQEWPIVITPKKTGMLIDRIVFHRLDVAATKSPHQR